MNLYDQNIHFSKQCRTFINIIENFFKSFVVKIFFLNNKLEMALANMIKM